MYYVALGSRVKRKRLELNLTQERLAELADISAVYVGQIERGERHMTIDVLVKLSEILKISVEELLKDSTKENVASRMKEISNLLNELNSSEIDRLINVIKAMYF